MSSAIVASPFSEQYDSEFPPLPIRKENKNAPRIVEVTIIIRKMSGEEFFLTVDPSMGKEGILQALHRMDSDAYPLYCTTVFPLSLLDSSDEEKDGKGGEDEEEIKHESIYAVFVEKSETLKRILLCHSSRFDKTYLPEPSLYFEFEVDRSASLASFEMSGFYQQPYPLTKEEEIQTHPKQTFYIRYLPQNQTHTKYMVGYKPSLRTSGSYFEWKEDDLLGCLEDVIGRTQRAIFEYDDIPPHPEDRRGKPSYSSTFRLTTNAIKRISHIMNEILPLYTHHLPPPCQTMEESQEHKARSVLMASNGVPPPKDITLL